MSLLAPLYFAGALAIGLPILFHLIRQRPKTHRQFGSLMFLDPTPPTLTRRSRLDQWPLLLMRTLALLLLAAAFARPFFRSIDLSDAQSPPHQHVILVDTSASMQRSGLWLKAIAEAERVITGMADQDRLAIVSFDRKPTTLLRFGGFEALPNEVRRQSASAILADLKPTANATDISAGLVLAVDAATEMVDAEESSAETAETAETGGIGPTTIHLISDMQAGGNLTELQSFVWPALVQVLVHRVTSDDRTNAAAFLMTPEATVDAMDDADPESVRVRVINSPDSRGESFTLAWQTDSKPDSDAVSVQVPPGQTRIVRMNTPPPGSTSIILRGDDHPFDNVRYFSIAEPKAQTIGYFGDLSDDARDSLLYYLQRAPLGDRSRTINTISMSASEFAGDIDATVTPLLVIADSLLAESSRVVDKYLQSGGRVLFVLDDSATSPRMTETLDRINDGPLRITEAEVTDYHMLSKIQFSDTMFDAMSDPQFNDFTKVRFWSHRRVTGLDEQWNVTATFDDGDVAMARRTVGAGQVILLTAGWQPKSSQLALSTKFIPLLAGWLGPADSRFAIMDVSVGDPLPANLISADGKVDRAEAPGLMQIDNDGVVQTIAVNIAASESDTQPVDDEALEQLGVTIGQAVPNADAYTNQRQLRDRELESRQNIWRWLLVAALAFLAIETWLAGRLSRSPSSPIIYD